MKRIKKIRRETIDGGPTPFFYQPQHIKFKVRPDSSAKTTPATVEATLEGIKQELSELDSLRKELDEHK